LRCAIVADVSEFQKVLEEDKRRKRLLQLAMDAADDLSPVSRRDLYLWLENRIRDDLRSGQSDSADVRASDRNDGSFVDRAYEFLLTRSLGATTRQVADAIGQKVGPADSTLRLLVSRSSVSRRGKLWFAKAPSKSKEPTLTQTIRQIFASNGNRPLAVNELFAAVRETLPNVRKGSLYTLCTRMRKRKELVQNGSGARGGLYQLAQTGGASGADVQ
jgi:hypothetical protein